MANPTRGIPDVTRPFKTMCSICGEPRSARSVGHALCEAHLQEMWRTKKKKQNVKRMMKKKGFQ